MNTYQLQSEIVTSFQLRDKDKILKIHTDLVSERNKLDKWFSKFVDMFSENIGEAAVTDPVRVLYDKKYTEYSKISKVINIAETYLKRDYV